MRLHNRKRLRWVFGLTEGLKCVHSRLALVGKPEGKPNQTFA